jgi:transposase
MEAAMEVLYPRCAGLDVHKDTVVVAVRIAAGGAPATEVRTFDTTTPGLLALSAWLAEHGCTHVAMEATGVYWKPVWHVLSDEDRVLILATAAHVKNVPGRKTDVADAAWLADLLAHGLIRASVVPEAPTQAMRALLRTRKQLVREQASHIQRIQKTLEDANLKLSSVLSQIMGKSGRAILQALIDGETDPDVLLTLLERGVKTPPERIHAALQGRITPHHRFLLRLHLRQIEALEAAIGEIDAEVDRGLDPFRQAVRQLQTIPGISDLTAQIIVSEIGTDMSRFPTAGHLNLLGRTMPAQRRERRQAPFHPAAQGSALAQDHSGAMRLGGRAQKGQLPAGSVSPPTRPPWRQKGNLCRRRIQLDRRLSHAARRHVLPAPRRHPLSAPITQAAGSLPSPPDRQARLSVQAYTHQQGGGFCLAAAHAGLDIAPVSLVASEDVVEIHLA